ncbi:MAG: secretin N-terminal domain-containing protein [Candidatus Krumholzibacteriia bacterium]
MAATLCPVAPLRADPDPMQLNVKNVSVLEVLALLADAGGFNIAVGGGVKGSVTLSVQDIEPRDLLDLVVGVVDAAYVAENGAIWVMTREDYEKRYGQPFVDNLVSRTFVLEQASVKDVMPGVTALLGDRAIIKPDLAGNTLTIKAAPKLVREAVQMLAALDRPAVTRGFQLHSMSAGMAAGLLAKMVGDGAVIVEDPVNQRLVVSASEFELKRIEGILGQMDVGGGIESAILPVAHAHADSLADVLRGHLTVDTGMIHSDHRSRQIVVVDYPPVVARIRELARAFDIPQRQVLLEAKILQVSTGREIRSGIDWSVVQDQMNLSGSFPTLVTTDPGLRGDLGDLSAKNYQIIVQALEIFGETRLLSSPRLMVLDGGSGLIHVGSQVPYKTIDTRETAAGTLNQFEKVVIIDVGVKLEVTVNISGADMIVLKVRPEVSAVTGEADGVPIVDAATTDSSLLVQDGNTVILGGLIKDETRKVRKGVPVLSRLPLLKYLFSSNQEETYRSEMIILLTPRIMTGRELYTGTGAER